MWKRLSISATFSLLGTARTLKHSKLETDGTVLCTQMDIWDLTTDKSGARTVLLLCVRK